MATTQNEEVFESYGLNPQLFVNEVLNAVDEVVEEAFDFYQQQASEVVGGSEGSSNAAEEVERGIGTLYNITQSVLDKQLNAWENYCLHNCFTVPEDFSSQATDLSGNYLSPNDMVTDFDLDAQIQSLRLKLLKAGREYSELNNELQALERQSATISNYEAAVAEVFREYEAQAHGPIQEIKNIAPTLYLKVQESILSGKDDMDLNLGLFSNLEEVNKALDLLKKIST